MGKTTQIKADDGHVLSAYVAEKPGNNRWIVVIQEAFGINGHIRNVCDQFAERGINAISPALFDRVERNIELPYTVEGVTRYQDIRRVLCGRDTLKDVLAAADKTGSKSVGVVGYGYGGTVSWWSATETTRFAAASCWYGGGIYLEKHAEPQCAVQMHFGEKDPHIPFEHVDAIRHQQPGVELWVYDGAEHGFGCEDRPSFHAYGHALAFQRTVSFFEMHVQPGC